MSTKIPPFKLAILLTDLGQLQRYGVPYGYGAKAEGGSDPRDGRKWNPRSTGKLSTPISTIDNLDCSGLVRYETYRATEGKLILPDGSQAQRAWAETMAQQGLLRKVSYEDSARYVGKMGQRLFINFIRPGFNGCGDVGHVFFGLNVDADATAETFESYGGHGVGSRVWNTAVLKREVYSTYELPTA